jgi:predicted phosphoribosyltransferase
MPAPPDSARFRDETPAAVPVRERTARGTPAAPASTSEGNIMSPKRFRDRIEAGQVLAARLNGYAGRTEVVVLALPRGGVPVGYEVARALQAPLDVFLVRKLGVPGHEELAMGAVATGGVRVVNEEVVGILGIPRSVIEAVAAWELDELARRERLYRGDRPNPEVRGRSVILVDDGLATGSTMLAAARALRKQQPARIVVAVPIASRDTCELLRKEVDDVVCAATPEPFHAVGLWYEDFTQTSDEEVRELLAQPTVPAARSQEDR